MEEKQVVLIVKGDEISIDYGEMPYHEFIGLIQTVLQHHQVKQFLPIISKMVDEHFEGGE